MTAPIAIRFRIETDAVRRCADLRRLTSGLRAAVAAVHRMKSAAARFPRSVLGNELLDLMSQRFHDFLAQSSSRRNAAYGRDARREFGEPANVEPGDVSWLGMAREKSRSAAFEAGGTDMERAAFESSGPSVGPATGAVAVSGRSAGRRPSPAWESAVSGGFSPFPWLGAPPLASRSQPAVTPGTLLKELREYWEMERREAASRLAVPRVTEPRESGQRVAEMESRSAAEVLRFGQTTFFQRLQAFVSGREPSEHTSRAPWREAAESAPDAGGPRAISEPTAGTPLSGDFAARLADTLRSQATQHGIDLT